MKSRFAHLRSIAAFATVCLSAQAFAQTTHTFTAGGSSTTDGTPAVQKFHWGDAANWDAFGIPNSATSTASLTAGRGIRIVNADGTTASTTDLNVFSFNGAPATALVMNPTLTGNLGGINLVGTNPAIDNQSATRSVFYYANITGTSGAESATSISYAFTPGTPPKNFARLKVVQVP